MLGVCLAKGLVDLTFGGAFAWYLVKFLVSLLVAFLGIKLGIEWRKRKIAKAEAAENEA